MATMTRCANCGGAVAMRKNAVRAQPLGRTVKYTERRLVCESCGATYVDDDSALANRSAWVHAYGPAVAAVTGEDLRLMREASNLTRPQLEAILGVGTNTVSRWEDGTRPLPPYIAMTVRMLAIQPTLLRDMQRLVAAGYVKRERVSEESLSIRERAKPAVRTRARKLARGVKGNGSQ